MHHAVFRCVVILSLSLSCLFVYSPRAFDVNALDLETKFKSLQKRLHPDRYFFMSQQEQLHSAEHASAVNIAYQTLKDPLKRAKYLVRFSVHAIVASCSLFVLAAELAQF